MQKQKVKWYFVTKIVLTYCEKIFFIWLRKTFEVRGWRPRIFKIFETTLKIYSNSEWSEDFLVIDFLSIDFKVKVRLFCKFRIKMKLRDCEAKLGGTIKCNSRINFGNSSPTLAGMKNGVKCHVWAHFKIVHQN